MSVESEDVEEPQGRSFNVAPSLSDAQAVELGHLVAWWAFLEYQVAVIATDLLGVSLEEGRVVFTQMNVRPRLQTISLLAPSRIIYEKDRKRLAEFRTKIEEAQAKRNLLAHGLWSQEEGKGQFVLQMWGGKDGLNRIEVEPHPMDEIKIAQISGEIAELAGELTFWWGEVRERLMPSAYRGS